MWLWDAAGRYAHFVVVMIFISTVSFGRGYSESWRVPRVIWQVWCGIDSTTMRCAPTKRAQTPSSRLNFEDRRILCSPAWWLQSGDAQVLLQEGLSATDWRDGFEGRVIRSTGGETRTRGGWTSKYRLFPLRLRSLSGEENKWLTTPCAGHTQTKRDEAFVGGLSAWIVLEISRHRLYFLF